MAATKIPGEFVGVLFPEGTTVFVDSQYHAWKRWANGREEPLTKNRSWVMHFIKAGDWRSVSEQRKETQRHERPLQRANDPGPSSSQAATNADNASDKG